MKSYSQFIAESSKVTTNLIEEVYQDLLDSGYTAEQISASYYFYEHLVEEGVLTENPLGGLARLGGRVLPGVGAGLYGYDAIQRARKGDWGGAALQGLGAGLSLVPGVGTLGALAPAAINMATDAMGLTGDKSKGQPGYKPPAASTPSAPAASTPSASTPAAPAAPKNTTVLAKKGGVEGVLDKATGKWTAKNWGDEGRSRYQTARGADQLAKDKAAATGDKIKAAGQKYGAKAFSAQPKKEPAKQTPTAVLPAQAPSKLGDKTPYSKEATAKMSPRTQRILSGQSVYNRDPLARGTR